MSGPCPLLFNARAGALHETAGPGQLHRMAREVGLELEIIGTHSPEELCGKLKELVSRGVEKVAVAGGDGTVALAVQVLAHTRTALGILPTGTFNNFASALRLHHNFPAALRTLKDGTVQEVDLGRVGDRYFTESAGAGIFADALALYGARSNKNLIHGLRAGFELLLAFRSREMTLTVDGKQQIARVTLCEVANAYRIAQAVPIAPEADVSDGKLNLVLAHDLRRDELIPYYRAMRAQMHLDLPKIQMMQCHEVRLESRQPRSIHCDDHTIGFTPQVISVQPGALKVLVDPRV